MATNKRRRHRQGEHRKKQKPTVSARLSEIVSGVRQMDAKQKLGIGIGFVCAIMLIAFITVALLPRPLRFTTDAEGNFVDGKNQITYYLAPISFEPERWQTDAYASCGDRMLYRISDLNPERWLCEVSAGEGSVWYASTIDLPSLSEFRANRITVCTQTETVMALKTIDNEAHVDAVIEALETGEAVKEIPVADRILSLKFSSSAYPRLFYDISYLECPEGNFLYDRSTEKCVEVGRLLVWYINRTGMEPDASTLIDDPKQTLPQTEAPTQTEGQTEAIGTESSAQTDTPIGAESSAQAEGETAQTPSDSSAEQTSEAPKEDAAA